MRRMALLLTFLVFAVPAPSALAASSGTSDNSGGGDGVAHPEQRYDRTYVLEPGSGGDKTERAVLKALRWLKENQNEDGSWGKEPLRTEMTGLGLLCFLGHGEDHLSTEFGASVRAAIVWLVGHQDKDGSFADGPDSATQHGIATYATAEAYAMTGLEDLRPVVAKAIRHICDGQTDEGGWYENYAKTDESGKRLEGGDTCVSGWQIQALTAAWYAGIRFPDNMLRDARKLAAKDMKSRFAPETGFGDKGTAPSRTKEQNYCTTAIGALCLQHLGQRESEEVKTALGIMKTYTCDWQETDAGPPGPLLGWYYVTQAMFHATDDWRKNEYRKYWQPLLNVTIVNHQYDDGHWEFPASESGQREKVQFEGQNRVLYSTAMCCLALEVCYHYLPTYGLPPADADIEKRAKAVTHDRGGKEESLTHFVVTLDDGELDVNGQPMRREGFLKQLSAAEESPADVRVTVCWFQDDEREDVISLVRALTRLHVLVIVVPPPESEDAEPDRDEIF
jgi:hypothetical protein